MQKLKIVGGKKLTGEIPISGAKNSAVALIPAAILCDEETNILNIPEISDRDDLIEIMTLLGAEINSHGEKMTINSSHVQNKEIKSLKTIQELTSSDQFKDMMKNHNTGKLDLLYKYKMLWKIKKQLYKEKIWSKLNKNDKK